MDNGQGHAVQSHMRAINKLSDDPSVIGGPPAGQSPLWRRLQPRLSYQARRGFSTANPTQHSIAWPATGLGRELQQRHRQGQTDLVHLHWLGDSTISIEEIGRLSVPLIWTLHDQWAFCGAEHYTSPPRAGELTSTEDRFVGCYTQDSRPSHEAGPDLNRHTWLRKRRAWLQPIHIIATTRWLADCAKRSELMGQWPLTLIPNPIDLLAWAPINQSQARALLNLPPNLPLVLFGAVGGTADPRKGADLLMQALQILRTKIVDTPMAELELVVFGQSRPTDPPALGFPIRYAGRLHDDISLRLLYAAADVMVVPSRQEAFGQTASEAHACGTPVVAFRTGGLVDIIDDRITGALAEPFDPASLADAIGWVLMNTDRRRQLSAAARMRAERLWDPVKIEKLYLDAYIQTIKDTPSAT
jgi:glycosyltransferase involved in cell wall biosynthesis